MSTKARVTQESRTPVVTPRNRTRSLSDSDEEFHLSPVQRMLGKISLSDPEIIRRIIFDPSLEPYQMVVRPGKWKFPDCNIKTCIYR